MRTLTIPGFVDAHCHAFQRSLRGRASGGDFWAWRDEMIAHAETITVAEVRREYAEVYRELRANGYTAVGEFHYLGLDEARAAHEAAAEAGIAFVCLYACYLRGGSPRFRQASVAEYLTQLEALRDGRDRGRGRPPLGPRVPGRRAARARRVRGRARPAAARARRRAAT